MSNNGLSMKGREPVQIPFEMDDGPRPIVLDAHTQAEFNRHIRPAFGLPADTPLFEIIRRLEAVQTAMEELRKKLAEGEELKPGHLIDIDPKDDISLDEKKMCEAVDVLLRKEHPEVIGVADIDLYSQIFYAALAQTVALQIRVGKSIAKKRQGSPQLSAGS